MDYYSVSKPPWGKSKQDDIETVVEAAPAARLEKVQVGNRYVFVRRSIGMGRVVFQQCVGVYTERSGLCRVATISVCPARVTLLKALALGTSRYPITKASCVSHEEGDTKDSSKQRLRRGGMIWILVVVVGVGGSGGGGCDEMGFEDGIRTKDDR
ncbi:hypothetical protein M0802_002163 [Mischocyttarus mexicanus]|nr:hypothetical protein M0802_002163 [Mischocyttarus mexicanus]